MQEQGKAIGRKTGGWESITPARSISNRKCRPWFGLWPKGQSVTNEEEFNSEDQDSICNGVLQRPTMFHLINCFVNNTHAPKKTHMYFTCISYTFKHTKYTYFMECKTSLTVVHKWKLWKPLLPSKLFPTRADPSLSPMRPCLQHIVGLW